MAQIDHPNDDGTIEVEVIDTASHRGHDMVQVQATDDGVTLTDQSGNPPWVFDSQVEGYEVLA